MLAEMVAAPLVSAIPRAGYSDVKAPVNSGWRRPIDIGRRRLDQADLAVRGARFGFVAGAGAAAFACRPFWPSPIRWAIARRTSE